MKTSSKKQSILKRLIKYAIGGSISSGIDLILFIVLVETLKIYYVTSAAISFSLAYIFYFFVNRKWTFKETKTTKRIAFPIFMSYAVLAIFLTIALIYFLTDMLNIHYLISKILTLVLVGIISFTFHYNISFKMRTKKKTLNRKTIK